MADRTKIARITNQIPDLTVRKAVHDAIAEIVGDLEAYKAAFDSHTHSANDTGVVVGQQFPDPSLTEG